MRVGHVSFMAQVVKYFKGTLFQSPPKWVCLLFMHRTYSVCPDGCAIIVTKQGSVWMGQVLIPLWLAQGKKSDCRLFKQAWAPLGSPITHMCCEVLSQQEAGSPASPADGPSNIKGTHTYNDIQLKTQEQTSTFTGNWLSAKCSRDWMGKRCPDS